MTGANNLGVGNSAGLALNTGSGNVILGDKAGEILDVGGVIHS